ncbi:hypothetical protein [Kitasatospora sp. NPDC056531]|uniref:hypothetical protein n=1 Tax=Kitasatospora sp. NPDC056531 TaxID=3345856 RepID=UPI0036B863A8
MVDHVYGLQAVVDHDHGGHQPTEKGRALFPVITALRQWGDQWFFAEGEPRARLVDRASGEPVAPVEVRAADGRLLGPEGAKVLLP